MIKSLDISIYEDGYGLQNVDCINNPLAAATGYFDRDNYFNYCFLHSIMCNLEDYEDSDFLTYSNKILNTMGLELIKINISELNSDEV